MCVCKLNSILTVISWHDHQSQPVESALVEINSNIISLQLIEGVAISVHFHAEARELRLHVSFYILSLVIMW